MLNALLFLTDPSLPESVRQQASDDTNLYSLIFLLIGIAAFIITTFQLAIFTIVGEDITRKIRI